MRSLLTKGSEGHWQSRLSADARVCCDKKTGAVPVSVRETAWMDGPGVNPKRSGISLCVRYRWGLDPEGRSVNEGNAAEPMLVTKLTAAGKKFRRPGVKVLQRQR